jgi:hypothetical protein
MAGVHEQDRLGGGRLRGARPANGFNVQTSIPTFAVDQRLHTARSHCAGLTGWTVDVVDVDVVLQIVVGIVVSEVVDVVVSEVAGIVVSTVETADVSTVVPVVYNLLCKFIRA